MVNLRKRNWMPRPRTGNGSNANGNGGVAAPASTAGDANGVNGGPRDKVFSCSICHRTFGYKHVLQNHERTHTGEKPFECKQCGKRFTRDHHLKTHMRLHTGEKPYNCTHCDRQFVQVLHFLWQRTIDAHCVALSIRCPFSFQISNRYLFDPYRYLKQVLTVYALDKSAFDLRIQMWVKDDPSQGSSRIKKEKNEKSNGMPSFYFELPKIRFHQLSEYMSRWPTWGVTFASTRVNGLTPANFALRASPIRTRYRFPTHSAKWWETEQVDLSLAAPVKTIVPMYSLFD